MKHGTEQDVNNEVTAALRMLDDASTDVTTAASLAMGLDDESTRDAALAGSSTRRLLPASELDAIFADWNSSALASLEIMESAFAEVAVTTNPLHYGGGARSLNNVSMMFTPSLSVHFVHWTLRQDCKGQRVTLDDSGCIKCVVNYIEKPKCWAAAVTGSILILPDVGVPMVKHKGFSFVLNYFLSSEYNKIFSPSFSFKLHNEK